MSYVNLKFLLLFVYMVCVYMCLAVYYHVCAMPINARRGHWIPETAVTGSYELPNVSAGN